MNAWTIAATIYATTALLWFAYAMGVHLAWKDAADRAATAGFVGLADHLITDARMARQLATAAPVWPIALVIGSTSKRGRRG